MEEQETYAGIGPISSCYIIAKSDLQPDGMSPKEGKAWTKLDAVPQTNIAADTSAPDAQLPSRGFKMSFELSFEVERKQNIRIHSMVEYSEENLQDCERLLRTWRPRLIARKKLLRASIRLSLAVLSWIKKQEPSLCREVGIQDVSDHISRMRLMLGKKVLVAYAYDPDTNEPLLIFARRHRRKVIGVTGKAKHYNSLNRRIING